MFDIGWGEFIVIGIVALIAIGPKELPGVLRTLGQWMTKIRRMGSEFQGQFQEAMREAEMADLKKDIEELNKQAVRSFETPFDSIAEAGTPATPQPVVTQPVMTGTQPVADAAQLQAEPTVAAPAPDAPKPADEGHRG
ncbi:MAG: sec-independent protein translocase protein TatB [Alphaproteobacteria bacterium]|jgi:sec-independent protein translocase protein TatB|nr:sec-independent protein translocase protein TatB [Alphaproteobacteria bacterium]